MFPQEMETVIGSFLSEPGGEDSFHLSGVWNSYWGTQQEVSSLSLQQVDQIIDIVPNETP